MPRIVGEVGARILERGLLVEHAGQRRVQTERRIRTRVAALLHEHHTTLAVPVSQRSSGGAERAKALHGHALTAVGIELVRVLPAGDDEELRREAVDDRDDELLDGTQVTAVAGSHRELDVDVEAFTCSRADLVRCARLWMRRAPRAMAHVHRHGQDVVSRIEALLGSVPVVDVPVEDGDSLDAATARVLGHESGVVEQAVAVGLPRLRVVPRRADERVRGAGFAVEHRVGGCDRGPGRGQCGLPGTLCDGRRPGEDAAATRAELANGLDVPGIVDELELGGVGAPPIFPTKALGEGTSLEDRLHVADSDIVLRMELGHVHEHGRRVFEDAAPCVVQECVVVPEDVEAQADPFAGSGRWESSVNWAAARVTRQSPAARRYALPPPAVWASTPPSAAPTTLAGAQATLSSAKPKPWSR